MNDQKARKYLAIALSVAGLSKENTKVGAVIIGPNGEGGPWGYNGACRGSDADIDWRSETREERLWWMAHAEANAIYAAARMGFPTYGCSIVVTHPPCMECAKSISQSGIKAVYCPYPDDEFHDRWVEHIKRSEHLFRETGVELIWL